MPFAVHEDHVLVPHRERGVHTVYFDDAYVWSFSTPRDGVLRPTGWKVPWPDPLVPRLNGVTVVSIDRGRERRFEQEVRFGDSTDRLRLVDRFGNPVAIDRVGHVARVFSATDPQARHQVIEGTRQALADLRNDGYDAHLSYGCLLGAVRDGRMIGHDTDADIAYVSRYTHPAQVISESYAMERSLRRRGWQVVRMSNADLKLMYPLPDGRRVHIDVFGAFHVGKTFYQLGGRSGTLPRSALTPAGTVSLEGVELPAPADPRAVLEFLYGPSWRVPDPAFQNVDPPGGLRRIQGWMRGVRDDVIPWNEYVKRHRSTLPRKPSTFARWVAGRLDPGAPVVDLGCGNGRDTLLFQRQGRAPVALDASSQALQITRRRLARAGVEHPDVRTLSLYDRRSVLVTGAELARTEVPVNLYARHLVGCLDPEGQDLLWLLCSMALRRGGSLFLEFSAGGRRPRPEPAHLLTRVRVEAVVAGITARGGLIDEVVVEPGEDYLDQPDPRVARIVAHWAPPTTDVPREDR
ncbi:MAG: methyltransferase domain-containing protein [Propionibacteriales bacterium]|nr:methyltransferase domain-containing protein [Propionibacteriales bacterium]